MNRWKNSVRWWGAQSITTKFSLAFAVLLLLMFLILVMSVSALTITRRATNTTMFTSMHIQHLVLEMDRRLEKSRRLERDFFLHYPRIGFLEAYHQYAQPAVEQVTQVRVFSVCLQDFLKQADFSQRWQEHEISLKVYLSAVDRHAEMIEDAVALVSGLADDTTGLQSQLAAHSSRLSTLVQIAEDPALPTLFRDMQLYEKDYLITRQRPFMQSAFNVARVLQREIEQTAGLDAGDKTLALDSLEAYQGVAEDMLDLNVAIRSLFNEFDLQAQAVDPIAEELITLTHEEIERVRSQVDRISRFVTLLLLVTAGSGVAMAGVIAFTLNISITRNIVKLSQIAGQFQAGRLHIRAQIDSHDELGHLASIFNVMATRINDLVDGLEKNVADRTEELSESNQQLQQEIQERRRVEQRVEVLNSMLLAIRNVNQLIVREKDQSRLLQRICENLTDTRGYYTAWIAGYKGTAMFPTLFASGLKEQYHVLAERLNSGKRTECLQAALGQKDVVFVDGPPVMCRECPLAQQYAGRSGMAARLEFHDRIYGVLVVSVSKDIATDDEERTLFLELAEDIAFALHNLELEQQRRLMDDELRAYSERLEDLVVERTAKLEAAQEQLVRREKLAVLGQMSGSVGHELRNPLAAISNAVYYLNMVLSDVDDEVREYLALVASETRNAERIVSDLLGFSRVRPGTRTSVAVSDLVEQAIVKQAPPDTIRVTTAIAADLPPVFVDAYQVEQILTNLISNAYQAMSEGGVLTVSAGMDNEAVALTIRDTGCGISAKNMSKLFEPLFTTKPKGIGLGLALSKTLIESNEGAIDVDSKEGVGSIFTIRLPIMEHNGKIQ